MNSPSQLDEIPRYGVFPLPSSVQIHNCDALIVGGGVAGLTAALSASEQGAKVALLSRDSLTANNSAWAQGGIAAALDTQDSPEWHVEDTLIAGAGLSDLAAVRILTQEAPTLLQELAQRGVPFERKGDLFLLGLEAGHSQRRIVHVGDATGWALTQILIAQAQQHDRIAIYQGYQAVDLLDDNQRCLGVLARDEGGTWHAFLAGATILATGGAGALYPLTSNQPSALGEGIALAYRAGAEVADMEFVQFHPTVMLTRSGQGFLISEAVRGEGGRLLTPAGYRFMPDYDPRAELAPRDIVTRAMCAVMQQEGVDHVLLDLTHLSPTYLEQRFPTLWVRCRAEGWDPVCEPIPVVPAAHYLMGGIRTDLQGRTTLAGLYAAGECACTGVHGANRLASNSLLECLVFGRRAAAAAVQELAILDPPISSSKFLSSLLSPGQILANHLSGRDPLGVGRQQEQLRQELTQIMGREVGPLRLGQGLSRALEQLATFPLQATPENPSGITLANAALCARLIVIAAFLRTESRGAHFRLDYPSPNPDWQKHLVQKRGQPAYRVATVAAVDRQAENRTRDYSDKDS